jgi:hypothetical protein
MSGTCSMHGEMSHVYISVRKSGGKRPFSGIGDLVGITYLLTYSLTHSMVRDIWKADCHSACQKISCFPMEPEGSLLCSHKPATGPYPEPAESSLSR